MINSRRPYTALRSVALSIGFCTLRYNDAVLVSTVYCRADSGAVASVGEVAATADSVDIAKKLGGEAVLDLRRNLLALAPRKSKDPTLLMRGRPPRD